jgi:hypothetical protein
MTTLDALLLWARTVAYRAVRAWKLATGTERSSAVVGIVNVLGFLNVAIQYGDGVYWGAVAGAFGLTYFVVTGTLDAIVARQEAATLRAELVELHAGTPTGAPRVVEVPCRHGDMHRFLYGPDGWEATGPALDTRPEEVRT